MQHNAAKSQQGQKESKQDDATEEEKKLAKEFGMTVKDYRKNKHRYVDAAKQGKDDRKVHVADVPKIGDESNEERFAAGGGMMGGDRGGGEGLNELTETIQAVKLAGPEAVRKERVKQEGRALDEMKSKREQQRQQQQQNPEQQHGQHENYQVIEVGIEERIIEDDYVQISPYVSSYEQDNNERGRGDNDQQQQPNLPVMAEGMRLQQPQQSPGAQHLNEGGAASLSSLLNDGTRNHNSPHYDPSHCHDCNRDYQDHGHQDHHHYDCDNRDSNRDHQGHGHHSHDNQDWGHHDPPGHYDHRDPSLHHPPDPPYPRDPHQGLPPGPPPPDPHHQFTIGSMVCVDVLKGDPLYGVVKWIGTLPEYPGTIAGVELVTGIMLKNYL